MRAKNREINIFNMSLLDILTGMLGAFLFLMVGLVPYYAKVMNSQLITADEKKKFDELKDLLDKGLKGPLSPEEVEKLKNEMERIGAENDKLRADNEKLQDDLDQSKKDLKAKTDEANFWANNSGSLMINSAWDANDADIDIFILEPDGTICGPKKEKLLGKDVFKEGEDSHYVANGAQQRYTYETTSIEFFGSGDYLVFYRVPSNAPPAAYAGLYGWWSFREIAYDSTQVNSGSKWVQGGSMGVSNAAKAKPGALYAWRIFTYNSGSKVVTPRDVTATDKLPNGIQFLH